MKTKIILGVIVVALIGGAFYWFQLRPAQIRRECSSFETEAIKSAKYQSGKYMPIGFGQQKTYEQCLTEHGLEK